MLGITRIHRYFRSPFAKQAIGGRETKIKKGTRSASKFATLLCTPRSVPPYICITPERDPEDRMPPT